MCKKNKFECSNFLGYDALSIGTFYRCFGVEYCHHLQVQNVYPYLPKHAENCKINLSAV